MRIDNILLHIRAAFGSDDAKETLKIRALPTDALIRMENTSREWRTPPMLATVGRLPVPFQIPRPMTVRPVPSSVSNQTSAIADSPITAAPAPSLEVRSSWLHDCRQRPGHDAFAVEEVHHAVTAPRPMVGAEDKPGATATPDREAPTESARDPHMGDAATDLPNSSHSSGSDSGIESCTDEDDNVWDEDWEPLTRAEQDSADAEFNRQSRDIEEHAMRDFSQFFDARSPVLRTLAPAQDAGGMVKNDPLARLLADIVAAQQERAARVAAAGHDADAPLRDARSSSPPPSQTDVWHKAFTQMVLTHREVLVDSGDDSRLVGHLPGDDGATWETDA